MAGMLCYNNTWQHRIENLQYFVAFLFTLAPSKICRYTSFFFGSRSFIWSKKLSAKHLTLFLWPPVMLTVQSTIFWTDTGRWTPLDKILSSGVSLIVSTSPLKWSLYISALFINLSRWFLIWFSNQLSSNYPCTVSLPGSL